MKKFKITSLICEALRDKDHSKKYEIGNGYYMEFFDGNDDGDNCIYKYGVVVGKLDENGDFDGEKIEFYLLEFFLDIIAEMIADDFGLE